MSIEERTQMSVNIYFGLVAPSGSNRKAPHIVSNPQGGVELEDEEWHSALQVSTGVLKNLL